VGRTIDITNFDAVTIEELEISRWVIDLNEEKVVAFINEIDTSGDPFKEIEVTFWVTIPEMPEIFDYTDPNNPVSFDPPQYVATPDTWYTLPSDRITDLVELTDEILAAVKGRLYS